METQFGQSHRFTSFAPLVLVADDEEVVRSLFHRLLVRQGLQVLLARDGQEAVELFDRHREQIRLVLLDVQMPRLDGPQALTQIRQIAPDVVSCFMTADAGKYDEKELLSGGARHVFAKPFRFAELMQALGELCGTTARCA